MKRLVNLVSLAVLCLCAFGCDEGGQKALPDATVTVVHAAAGFDTLDFLREERRESSPPFKGAPQHEFDEDLYQFNIETQSLISNTINRIRSFSQQILASEDYFFVLTEIGGLIEPLIVGIPVFDPASSNAEVLVIHAAPSFASADVYIEPPGTDLATVTAFGSIDALADLGPGTLPAGDYQFILTQVGNAANVLYTSPTRSLTNGLSSTFVLVDGANEGLAPLQVLHLSANPLVLFDINLDSGIRVINAAADMAARDVFANGQFSTPLIAALPFATASDYQIIEPEVTTLSVTPLGNPSVVEVETTFTAGVGALNTIMVFSGSNGLATNFVFDDHRSIVDTARVRLFNGATQFTDLELFIVPPGTDITTLLGLTLMAPGTITPFASFVPGDYELILREFQTGAIVEGPLPLTFEARGIYEILAVNGPDGSTADVVVLDAYP